MVWHLDIRLGIIVVVLALIQGGRYERLVAWLLSVRGLLNLLAPKWDWMDVNDWHRLTLFQAAFLVAFVWLLWRHRRPWLLVLVLLQAASVLLEGWCAMHLSLATERDYRALFYILAIGKSLTLGWAVVLRWITPPHPLPAGADPDLYEAASRRWGSPDGLPIPGTVGGGGGAP
jgi:hypothetical protein